MYLLYEIHNSKDDSLSAFYPTVDDNLISRHKSKQYAKQKAKKLTQNDLLLRVWSQDDKQWIYNQPS